MLIIAITPFFAAGSFAVTCRTHNVNVIASPVQFVRKINCCGVNFCRHTNPNIALKMRFVGYQKMGNFQAQHLYFSLQNLCLIDYHITFFAAGSYAVTCRTHNINVVASSVQFVPKINCCGVNFSRHTNPNIALKIKFVRYQKVGNFQAQHLYFSLQNLCWLTG